MSSTNRGSERLDKDEYQTPVWAVEKIIAQIDWNQSIRFSEPCLGEGNIFNNVPLPHNLKSCYTKNEDYLMIHIPKATSCDLIITNPPFCLALPFLRKSLKEATTVIYLLRLNFLESKERKPFWVMNPLTHLFVLSERLSFVWVCSPGRKIGGCGNVYKPGEVVRCECGKPLTKTDSTGYGWFCWDYGRLIKKKPGVYVL